MSANFDYWRKLADSPLPFVNDTQAGNGASQQPLGPLGNPNANPGDPGWRGSVDYTAGGLPGGSQWSAPSTQVPYTAPSTTGGGGTSAYTGNPWANYNRPDENAGFNYTQDPYYNAGADRPKWDLAQTGAGSEDDRSRVWRWTLEALGPDPGKRPQADVQAAYLASIKRLKDDYAAPENAAKGLTWASSPYAGYDQFLGSGGAGGAGGSTGGTGVNPPTLPMGQGLAAGATAAGGGGTADPNALGGGSGGIDQLYQNSQAYRTAQLLKALGLGSINDRLSFGGSVIASEAPKLFEQWREAQGVGGGGVPNGMGQLGAFANVYNSPGALGNIAQTGQRGLDWLMGQGQQGLSDEELIPMIQGFEQLANIRQSDVMNQYYNNLTNQGLFQFAQGVGPNNLNARLAPYLQSNPLFGFLTGKR